MNAQRAPSRRWDCRRRTRASACDSHLAALSGGHRRPQKTVEAPIPTSRGTRELCWPAPPGSRPLSLHRFLSGSEAARWWPCVSIRRVRARRLSGRRDGTQRRDTSAPVIAPTETRFASAPPPGPWGFAGLPVERWLRFVGSAVNGVDAQQHGVLGIGGCQLQPRKAERRTGGHNAVGAGVRTELADPFGRVVWVPGKIALHVPPFRGLEPTLYRTHQHGLDAVPTLRVQPWQGDSA